jgi:hypothetical protein
MAFFFFLRHGSNDKNLPSKYKALSSNSRVAKKSIFMYENSTMKPIKNYTKGGKGTMDKKGL